MIKIDLLYIGGCPNHEPTAGLIRDILAELKVEARVAETEIRTTDDAIAHRFLGSPTVRVNGEDIDRGALTRTDYGLSCRRYGGLGVPPRPMVNAAVQHGIHAQSNPPADPGERTRDGLTEKTKSGKKRRIARAVAMMISTTATAIVFSLMPATIGFTAENEATGLLDLDTIEQLRKRFNEDREDPRLLLLLSPT